jgi:hypothetical protein
VKELMVLVVHVSRFHFVFLSRDSS